MRTRQTARKNRNSCITRTQHRLQVTTSDALFIGRCILVFVMVMVVFLFMGGYIYMQAQWNKESTFKLKEEIIQLERRLQLEQDKMKPRNPVHQTLNNRIKRLNEEIKKYKEQELDLQEEIKIWQQSESRVQSQIEKEEKRINNLKEQGRNLLIQIKNLENSAKEQEDKAKELQKIVKANVPCIRILAYHWDLTKNLRIDPKYLNDLKIHFQKMDTVKIKLKFVFVSTKIPKHHFANLNVDFLKMKKKEKLVDKLRNKYFNLRVNQLFLINKQKHTSNTEYRHYILPTDKLTKTDLRNIEEIMQMNKIICTAMEEL